MLDSPDMEIVVEWAVDVAKKTTELEEKVARDTLLNAALDLRPIVPLSLDDHLAHELHTG